VVQEAVSGDESSSDKVKKGGNSDLVGKNKNKKRGANKRLVHPKSSVSPVASVSADTTAGASSGPLESIENNPSKVGAKPAPRRKASGSENNPPSRENGAGEGESASGDDEEAGVATPGGTRKKVKARKETKGIAATVAIETTVPPVKKRGRPPKGHGTGDKDGDDVPSRKKVRRSDDLAMAEANQITGPRVRVRTEKGQAQGKK
jgi:hypothetical protein